MTVRVRTFAAGYSIAPIGFGFWRWRVHFPHAATGVAFGRDWAMFAARSRIRDRGRHGRVARTALQHSPERWREA